MYIYNPNDKIFYYSNKKQSFLNNVEDIVTFYNIDNNIIINHSNTFNFTDNNNNNNNNNNQKLEVKNLTELVEVTEFAEVTSNYIINCCYDFFIITIEEYNNLTLKDLTLKDYISLFIVGFLFMICFLHICKINNCFYFSRNNTKINPIMYKVIEDKVDDDIDIENGNYKKNEIIKIDKIKEINLINEKNIDNFESFEDYLLSTDNQLNRIVVAQRL